MHHTDSEISRTMRFTPPGKASNGNMVFVCGGNEWLSGVQMVRELSYTALIFKRSAFYTFLRTGWLSPFMCIRFHIIFITTLTCLIPVNYLNRATWCLDLETAFFLTEECRGLRGSSVQGRPPEAQYQQTPIMLRRSGAACLLSSSRLTERNKTH